jgi:site-specific recombinase XerD
MSVPSEVFFNHMEDFFHYRSDIYEISDQTLKSNRTDLNLFHSFIGSKDYDSIDGPAVIDFQYYLKNTRDNCGASINRKIFTLRSYANFLRLYDVQAAEDLPFYDVLKIRSGYRNRPHALTPSQIQRLFESIHKNTVLGIRDYAVYALMYQLGLRVGEVHLLDMEDLDLKNKTITVMGKGRRKRTLHLNQELIEILAHYLALRDLFRNSPMTNALFISKKGNRLAIRTMEDNLNKILSNTNLRVPFKISCHTLRHSLASHLNDKDVDVLVIQSILGHSSPRSTEPYIHPSQERIRRAFEKLPSIIYVKELIKTGILNLRFQPGRRSGPVGARKAYRPKRE